MIYCARCWMNRSMVERSRIIHRQPHVVCCTSPYLSTEVA